MNEIKKFQFSRNKLLECEGLTLSEVYFILFYDPPLKNAKTIWKEKYILPTITKNISFKTKFNDAFIGQKKTSKSKPLVYIFNDFVYKGPYVNSTDKLRLMMFRRDFLTLLGDTTPEIKLYQVDDEIYVRMPYIGNSTEWKTETSKIIGEDKPRKIVTKESQGIEELLPYMKRVDNPDPKIIYRALIHYIHRVICDPVIGDPALRNILIVNNDIVCIDFDDNRASIDYTSSIFELLGGKANWATKDILEKFKKILDEKKSKIIKHLNSINLNEIKEMIETHMIADLVNIDNIKTNISAMKKVLLDLNETDVTINPREPKVTKAKKQETDDNEMTNVLEFYDPKDKFGELSNYFPSPIIYNGQTFATSEHLYQAFKFMYDSAPHATRAYAQTIRVAKTPNIAKILASQKTAGGYAWRTALNSIITKSLEDGVRIDTEWESVKEVKMAMILDLKFTQNAHCRDVLLSTGDRPLAEHTTRDLFWGDGGDGTGKNVLGHLLMKLRDKLRGKVVTPKIIIDEMTYKHNNSISRHGHSQDSLLSALQKYIRRGETEKAQYVGIELFLFNELPQAKALVTRSINRLRVILPEDTSGISSPQLTILFNKYYERSFKGVLSMIYLLSNAPKIRLISDIKMVFFSDMDKTEFPYYNKIYKPDMKEIDLDINYKLKVDDDHRLQKIANGIVNGIKNKTDYGFYWLNKLVDYVEQGITCAKRSVFGSRPNDHPMYLAFEIYYQYAQCGNNLWNKSLEKEPNPDLQKTLNICFDWYQDFGLKKKTSKSPKENSHRDWVIFVIWPALYCFRNIDWSKNIPRDPKYSDVDIENLLKKYSVPIELDDYVFDKHTKKGKQMKRGTKHFAEEGAFVENEDKELLNKYYRKLYLDTRAKN